MPQGRMRTFKMGKKAEKMNRVQIATHERVSSAAFASESAAA